VSKHLTVKVFYKVNYGYIPSTISGDLEELDAYVLGVDTPINTFNGVCIAIIHRLNEDDDKLIVVPPGMNFSNEEIRNFVNFQEQFFQFEIWR